MIVDANHKTSRPNHSFWVRVDRVVRWLHLYTGLFLVPWMLVYSASALFLNHGPMLREWLDVKPPKLELVEEVSFVPSDSFPEKWGDQAAVILNRLKLDGAYRVMPAQSNDKQLKILRISGSGNYIVTWNRTNNRVVVQQQTPFSWLRLVNFLHFKGGYGQPYPAHIIWAVLVDVVALSMAFWVASGVYIWARRPKKRMLGGVCVIGGSLLFVSLVLALCS